MTDDDQKGDRMPLDARWRQELDAYVDGLLDQDPQRLAAVEAFLAERPALRTRMEARRERNHAIRSALDPIKDEPVPERLSEMLQRSQPAGMARVVRNMAAILALVLVSGVTGWWIGHTPSGQTGPTASIARLDGGNGLTARTALAAASDSAAVENTAPNRLDLAVPDLRNLGLKERERHLVASGPRPTMRVRYATLEGESIDLLVQQRQVTAQPTYVEDGQRTAAIWSGSEHIYALVTRGDSAQMKRLANQIRAAIGGSAVPMDDSLPKIPKLDDQLTAAPPPEGPVNDTRDGPVWQFEVPNMPDTAGADL